MSGITLGNALHQKDDFRDFLAYSVSVNYRHHLLMEDLHRSQ